MKKRILFAVCLCALLVAFSMVAGAVDITSADDLLDLMNGKLPLDGDYTLTKSINLADAKSGNPQAPIGTNADNAFTGTFNGQGNTISGLNLDLDSGNVALFGYVANATIENLTVSGTVKGSGNAIGGIVGRIDSTGLTVRNCVNYCTVSGVDSVGGIVGRLEPGSKNAVISGCQNFGAISGARYVAGIAGFSTQSNGATTIEKCANAGAITASTSYAGGMAGYWRVYSGSKNKCAIQDCLNTGAVTVSGTAGYAGGIIGGTNQNNAYTLARCFNSGVITGSKYTRPIAGTIAAAAISAGKVTDCYYSSTDIYTADASSGVEVYVADATVASSVAGLGANWVLADGYAPELKAFHNHDYEYVAVGGNHQQICYCSYVNLTEEHNFADGVCDKCGAEDIPCAHENKYAVIDTAATCLAVGKKYEFCPDCNMKVSGDIEIPTDATNHAGTLTMAYANGAVTYTCECGVVVYTDNALLDTVYVSENGKELTGTVTAQVGTAANPFKNFTDAMQYAAYAGKDVTIRILDTAYTPKTYVTPAFDATITVTGGTLSTNNRFVMNGKFVFEHIKIAPTDTLVMAAKEHKLVMGEGITNAGSSIYLVGGYENGTCSNSNIPATGFATDITLRSGSYGAVGGGNRYLSGAYSGTIKLTIGKTNPSDTLEITSTLTTASMNYEGGDGVNATIIIDGTVDDINSFCPVSHATTANGRFDIDLVVCGKATTDTSKLYWRGSNYQFNVYADARVDGAEAFAASVIGAENVQPYSRYCIKVNGAHPDTEEDGFCDNCGASTDCAHEYGEWRETAAANCVSAEKYVWYCLDCKELIAEMTKDGDAVDSTNHCSESFVWQKADGAYFFACTACGENVPQDAPVLYVAQSGDNALDGTAPAKAVATVEEAVSRLANVGGKVVIVGTYVLESNLTLPAYSEEITLCGMESAGEFDGFSISKNIVITLGGKTKIDNISFGGSAVYIFECAWNDTVFGCVQPYGTATAYAVLGFYGITADDTAEKSAVLTITEGTSQRHTAAGSRYVDRFYAYIYLGDTIGAEGVSVANKTAVLNATNADIGILYTMSTTAKYKNAPVTGCETTVNLYGSTKVDKGRTGDYNVGYAESNAVLDKQTLNFFDNAYIGSNYYIRNAKETVINVSTVADGRTIPLRVPFTFYAYGTFAKDKTPMQMTVNCDSHSFASVVEAPCAFAKAADAVKVCSENVANVCAYTAKVTEAATPTANGTKLYSCYCGRSYTESFAYSCEDATHLYTMTDDAFVCDVCGETFTAPAGDNLFAITSAEIADGKATVVLDIDGTFAAALVKVAAPEGFTFASATLPTAEGFTVSGSETDGYTLALLANSGADETVDATMTLEYTCSTEAEQVENRFVISVPELYTEDGVATTVCAVVPANVPGDMNADGVLTVIDVLLAMKAVLNGTYTEKADVSGDGVLTLVDVMRILKNIVR